MTRGMSVVAVLVAQSPREGPGGVLECSEPGRQPPGRIVVIASVEAVAI